MNSRDILGKAFERILDQYGVKLRGDELAAKVSVNGICTKKQLVIIYIKDGRILVSTYLFCILRRYIIVGFKVLVDNICTSIVIHADMPKSRIK